MSPLQDELDRIRAETPDDDNPDSEESIPEEGGAGADEEADEAEAPAPPDVDPNAIEKEAKRHERALAKIMGAAWEDSEPCEACGTLGYVPQGHEPMPEMLPNPNLVKCRGCNGWGKRLTPALDPQYATEPCTDCQGKGFVDRATYETLVTPAAPQPFAGAAMPPPMPRWDEARGVWTDQYGAPIGQPGSPYAPVVNGPTAP